MNKYERLIEEIEKNGEGKMKVLGNSMQPRIESGSVLTYRKQETYEVNDVVLSKVKGRWIDAHKIWKIDTNKGYLIGNNKGYENGWTRKVFARAIDATINDKTHSL
jgi:phage repressor protein C with HTH and peptisase S24 domain